MFNNYCFVVQDLQKPFNQQVVWDFGICTNTQGRKWVQYIRKDASLFQKISFLFLKIIGKIDCSIGTWVSFEADLPTKPHSKSDQLAKENRWIRRLSNEELLLNASTCFLRLKIDSLTCELQKLEKLKEKPKENPLAWLHFSDEEG